MPAARIGTSALLPLPGRQNVYTLDFWILSKKGRPEKLAFTFFPVRGSRGVRQQLPRLPTARAQTAQTWEPVESLASCQTACTSVRGQGGGVGGELRLPMPRHHANMQKVELTLGMMPRAQELGIC